MGNKISFHHDFLVMYEQRESENTRALLSIENIKKHRIRYKRMNKKILERNRRSGFVFSSQISPRAIPEHLSARFGSVNNSGSANWSLVIHGKVERKKYVGMDLLISVIWPAGFTPDHAHCSVTIHHRLLHHHPFSPGNTHQLSDLYSSQFCFTARKYVIRGKHHSGSIIRVITKNGSDQLLPCFEFP